MVLNKYRVLHCENISYSTRLGLGEALEGILDLSCKLQTM
jgi:hypothetical protein